MDVCKDMQAECGTGVEEMQTRSCKKAQNQAEAETAGMRIGDRVDSHVHELIVHWHGSHQKLGRPTGGLIQAAPVQKRNAVCHDQTGVSDWDAPNANCSFVRSLPRLHQATAIACSRRVASAVPR